LFCALECLAQHDAVIWKFASRTEGRSVCIEIDVHLKPGWHIYSQHLPDGGPIPTRITFLNTDDFVLIGGTTEYGVPMTYHDELYGIEITSYSDSVRYSQKVTPTTYPRVIRGTVKFMICNEHACLPGTQDFVVTIK
jgi:DsbC/DsbD-like thiol-disulfide interchange protein